jgi:hypothetical protein
MCSGDFDAFVKTTEDILKNAVNQQPEERRLFLLEHQLAPTQPTPTPTPTATTGEGTKDTADASKSKKTKEPKLPTDPQRVRDLNRAQSALLTAFRLALV